MAMVMGPTPPGTGVIRETFFDTDEKSTSPTNWPATRLIPTSMTTALSFTISAVTKFGFPIAAIRIYADRARLGKFLVRE